MLRIVLRFFGLTLNAFSMSQKKKRLLNAHFNAPNTVLHFLWGGGGRGGISQLSIVSQTDQRMPSNAKQWCTFSLGFVLWRSNFRTPFRTVTVVSHTLVYVHSFRMVLNSVLSAKSTKNEIKSRTNISAITLLLIIEA